MYDPIFKIDLKHQGTINRFIFGYCTHPVIDWFYEKGYKPNHITTLSFLSQLLAVSYLLEYDTKTYSIFYFLGYYFDCIDGPMARKHNMVTVFGDWYDHITDIFCFIWVIYIYISQYALLENTAICIISSIYFFGLIGYVGCQEKIYNKNNKEAQISYSLYLTTLFVKDEYRYFRFYKFFCFTNSVLLFSLLPNFLSY
jgi:phosphatidylglycerophosphate synthase